MFSIDSLDVTDQIYVQYLCTTEYDKDRKKLNGIGTYETPFSIEGLRINSFDSILRVWG